MTTWTSPLKCRKSEEDDQRRHDHCHLSVLDGSPISKKSMFKSISSKDFSRSYKIGNSNPNSTTNHSQECMKLFNWSRCSSRMFSMEEEKSNYTIDQTHMESLQLNQAQFNRSMSVLNGRCKWFRLEGLGESISSSETWHPTSMIIHLAMLEDIITGLLSADNI